MDMGISNFESLDDGRNLNSSLVQNKIEALNALATLLIREIEALQSVSHQKGRREIDTDINLQSEIRAYETELIRTALIRSHGNQRSAAKALHIRPTTLNAKIKRFGIEIFEVVDKGPHVM